MAEDRSRDPAQERPREPRLRDFAKRFLRDADPSAPEESGRHDAREMLSAMLETGDKAKTEVIRMVAREVRTYLEELRAGEALTDLLTNYSVEVNASFHLRPLNDKEKAPQAEVEPPKATLRRKRAPKQEESEDTHRETGDDE